MKRWQLTIQKTGVRRRLSDIKNFAERRDATLTSFLRLSLKHQVELHNVWNMDQHGEHFDSIPDTTIAPKGVGKYLKQQTYKARERYTVTVGINGIGQIGFGCITFKETDADETKSGKFGPIVAGRLEKCVECQHLWLQASSSGLQHKEHVFDYFRNVVGWRPYKRLLLLDGLRSWQAIENKIEIEKITNGIICTIADGLTCLLQPCDTDLFRMFNARMIQQNMQHIKNSCENGHKSTKPRTRENVLTDVLIVLSDISINKQDVLSLSWKKNGYWLALDGSEDYIMRQNIYMNEQPRGAQNIPQQFQNASDRLNSKLPKGPKSTELGSSQPQMQNVGKNMSSDNVKINPNPLIAIRAHLRKAEPNLFKNIKFFPQSKSVVADTQSSNNSKSSQNNPTVISEIPILTNDLPDYLNDTIDESNETSNKTQNLSFKYNYNLYKYTDYTNYSNSNNVHPNRQPNKQSLTESNHCVTNSSHKESTVKNAIKTTNNNESHKNVNKCHNNLPNCSNIIKPDKIWSTQTCDQSQLKKCKSPTQHDLLNNKQPSNNCPSATANPSTKTQSSLHNTDPSNTVNDQSDSDVEVVSPKTPPKITKSIDITNPKSNEPAANKMWNILSKNQRDYLWSKRIGAWYWYVLNSKRMLYDYHIEAAYDLLKQRYPKYNGLGRVCIQRSDNDNIKSLNPNAVGGSIFHCDPAPHWIFATRLKDTTNIFIYDSLGITFNALIRRSVAELFGTAGINNLSVEFKPCANN